MHVRVVIAAIACVALVGCASTKSSQRKVSTASKRVYQQSATPRTSTPQARRMPAWPAQNYRAPSTRTYAAAPTTRRAAPAHRASPAVRAPSLRTQSFAGTPPPPPPPPLYGRTAPRTTSVTPARAPTRTGSVIRPASRPARAATFAAPTAPAVKPIAPLRSSRLFKDSGTYSSRGTSYPSSGFISRSSSRRTKDCKT